MPEEYSGDLKELIDGLSSEDLMDIDGIEGDGEVPEVEVEKDSEEAEEPPDEGGDAASGSDAEDSPPGDESEGDVEDSDEDADDSEAPDEGGDEEDEGAEGEEKEPEPKKWQLKAYGKEKEITSEEELLKYANIGMASDIKNRKANEKLSEAKTQTEQAQRVLEALDRNPINSVLELYASKLGSMQAAIDAFDKHLNDYLKPRVEADEKEYKQRQDLEWRERRLLEKEERERAEAERRQVDAYWANLTREVHNQLEARGLPKTKLIIGRVAKIINEAVDLGLTPDAKEAVEEVARGLKPEESAAPEDKARQKADKKAKIEKVKRSRVKRGANSQGGQKPTRRERQARPKASLSEFFLEQQKEIFG